MSDLVRNLEKKTNTLLNFFPVVIIIGVRQGGKTTLSKKIRPGWKYFDLEKSGDYTRVTRDYDFFFKENPESIIFDEAQESTDLFRELRSVIDSQRNKKNRFIITGSSSFELLNNISESLPGRAGIIELGTLKCNEFYENPLPSFYNIFSEKFTSETIKFLKTLKPHVSHKQIIEFFLHGGYPEPALEKNPDFINLWMENYFHTYVDRDIRKLFPKLNLIRYRRLVGMLTSLSGTIINRSDLGRSLDTSEVTIKEYLDIVHNTFIWRNIPSYVKSSVKSIVKMPKGIFRDSGLVHYFQRVRTKEQLDIYPNIGTSFESFIIEEIIKGIEATMTTGWNYYYYRTKHGSEIDLILEGDFGLLPVEIKYGMKIRQESLTSLTKFIKDNNVPFGIIINNSDSVEMINEKIIQIPAGII